MSGGKRQTTIDKPLKKVSYGKSDKEKEELEERMRSIVQEEVKKVRKERVIVEKLKIDFDAKNAEITERLEALEVKFEEFKDDVKARLATISVALEAVLAPHYSDYKECISIYTVYIDIHFLQSE